MGPAEPPVVPLWLSGALGIALAGTILLEASRRLTTLPRVSLMLSRS